MSETYTGVIALADVSKIINMRFESGIVFVIDVLHLLFTKPASLAGGTVLRKMLSHIRV